MPQNASLQRQFELAVDEYAGVMYRVAYRMIGRADGAEELVQETFFQAWKGLASLREPSRMRGWLFGILHRQYLKHVHQRARSRVVSFPANLDQMVVGGAAAESGDPGERVQAALEQLEDNHKLPILLVSMEGLSVDEAAEVLGWPRGTVLSRLHRGRQRLRQKLERQIGIE